MKRAFPQEESKPVLFSVINNDALPEQPKQTLPDANRRVRKSAAMIGLAAISMGAYSLLAPHQGDSAVAAEPVATEPTLPTVANSSDVAVISTASEVPTATNISTIQTVEHTVQEGQTLWKIAKFYKVDIDQIASANNLRSSALLYVGQVLQVPGDGQSAQVPATQETAKSESSDEIVILPAEPVAIVASSEPRAYAPKEAQQLLKSRQDVAVANLKQQRDRLKLSLAELRSEESKNASKSAQADPSQPKAEAVGLVSYQVSPGDTLTAIAQTHGISYSELAKINQLTNPNLLEVDQFIKVPQAQAALAPQSIAPAKAVSLPSESATVASVSLPALPSLTIANSPEPIALPADQSAVPLGIGGDASQLALNSARSRGQSSFTGTPLPVKDRQADDQQYVSSLVSEIVKLREKYQSKPDSFRARHQMPDRVQAPVPVSLSLRNDRRVNPEFKPSRSLEGLQAELRSLQSDRKAASGQTKLDALVADVSKKPQMVAMAPAGSETYAPLVRSSVGKMVSPSLPPLGNPDAYLPGNSGKFNGYIWPAKGMLTSGYGWRWGRMHKGIDIAAPVGTPIVSAAPGKVITAGWNDGGYGNLVEVKHADGSVTLYAHNSRILAKVGQTVAQGQQIAEMGSTGFSTGPHSHFEVHIPGQGAVNPVARLPQFRG